MQFGNKFSSENTSMKPFKISLIWLKVIGIDNRPKTHPLKSVYIIHYIIQTLCLQFVIVPSTAYAYCNLKNIEKLTDSAYVVLCFVGTMFILWSFVVVRDKIMITVNDLTELIERSK